MIIRECILLFANSVHKLKNEHKSSRMKQKVYSKKKKKRRKATKGTMAMLKVYERKKNENKNEKKKKRTNEMKTKPDNEIMNIIFLCHLSVHSVHICKRVQEK